MLDRLLLQNFQAHQQLELRLAPITVLVGDNGAGKSSLVRALRWLLLGKPTGSLVVRWDASQCQVQARLDGQRLGKRRRSSGTWYRWNEEEFAAAGSRVPEPIAQHLQLDELINFQGQHDPPFLLSMTGGQAATALNRIVDLEVIDQVVTRANLRLRKAKLTLQISRERWEQRQAACEALAYVPELKRVWQDVVQLQRRAAAARERQESLQDWLEHWQSLQTEHQQAHQRVRELTTLLAKHQALLPILQRKNALQERIGVLVKLQQQLQVPLPKLPQQAYDQLRKSQAAYVQLEATVKSLKQLAVERTRVEQAWQQAQQQLQRFATCPTCGALRRVDA